MQLPTFRSCATCTSVTAAFISWLPVLNEAMQLLAATIAVVAGVLALRDRYKKRKQK